jgi:hypothetical protein
MSGPLTHRAKQALKELSLAAEARCELNIPKRGGMRWREPPELWDDGSDARDIRGHPIVRVPHNSPGLSPAPFVLMSGSFRIDCRLEASVAAG